MKLIMGISSTIILLIINLLALDVVSLSPTIITKKLGALRSRAHSLSMKESQINDDSTLDVVPYIPSEVLQRRQEKLKEIQSARKRNSFDLVVDDFVGKRFGKGKVFYGQSFSELNDIEIKKLETDAAIAEESSILPEMKRNAILVVGATGQTGQWVVLNLLGKGFNCRLFSRNLEKTEKLFGSDGATVDIVIGDVRDKNSLIEAARGCQAAIYCAGSRILFGNNSFKQVDGDGVVNFVNACVESGTVRKIVLQSSVGVEAYMRREGVGGFDSGGNIGVFINNVFGNRLKAKAAGEASVRESNLPYVIVRSGGLRNEAGGKHRIIIDQGDKFVSGGISHMDAAEAIVESLLSETENVTFEVRNSSRKEEEIMGMGNIPRRASSVEIDPDLMMEKFEMETEEIEAFWTSELSRLKQD